MGGYTRVISGQRLGKHVPVKQTTKQCPLLGSRFLIMQQLDYNKRRTVFSTWSVSRGYTPGPKLVDSSVRESVKRGLELETDE
jgi:hypothetical protein